MKDQSHFSITRERHLDHMVKVVPFIVGCYALQSYIILKIGPGEFSSISLSILGGFIAIMIAGFICYDLKHKVVLSEVALSINFFWQMKNIPYEDIIKVDIKDPGQTFSNLIIVTAHRKHTFYFIDDAEKIKVMIDSKKNPELKAA